MIIWQDNAIVLNKIKYGENHAIVTFLTENHGKVSGLVYGAFSRKKQGILETGNIIKCDYSSKTENSFATIKVDLYKNTLASVMDNMEKLLIVSSSCKIIYDLVPEHDNSLNIYNLFIKLLYSLDSINYLASCAMFEWEMLNELGFGINTDSCVATGNTSDFAYVSPKSWQVVSRLAGDPYKNVLLALPSFLIELKEQEINRHESLIGLKLTNHFLEQVYKEQDKIFKPLSSEILKYT